MKPTVKYMVTVERIDVASGAFGLATRKVVLKDWCSFRTDKDVRGVSEADSILFTIRKLFQKEAGNE
jgi:hypothetical protein